jgi:phospholipid N-methyltransferase
LVNSLVFNFISDSWITNLECIFSFGSIKEKINEWKTRGAVAPSSKFLVKKMLSKIDFREDLDLLQLGYGNGVFTKEIVRKISKESTLVVFEVDKQSSKSA